MEFKSDKTISLIAGLILSSHGAFALLFVIFLGDVPLFVGVLGLVCLVAGIAAFFYEHRVEFDRERGIINKRISFPLWQRYKLFRVNDFKTIVIGSGAGSSIHTPSIIYVIELKGVSKLRLPGIFKSEAVARGRAEELASFLGIPVEQSVHAGF